MKDRLVELCKVAHSEWLKKEYDHETEKDLSEYVADYLLANGVVIIDPVQYPPITNRDIIDKIMGMMFDEVADLIRAKEEGRIIVTPCISCDLELDRKKNAEALYNAGYRRQIDGKWKKLYDKAPRYVCTACNHLFNNKEYKFCPNCGAHMRKEGEGK